MPARATGSGSGPADLIVEADGGSRGNPGVAGYGALVRSGPTGKVLAERAEPLGRASNNVAEYTGLIEGLRLAAALDPGAAVEVRMDSKLVVEQMAGRWKIKHEDMRRLASQARDLLAQRAAAGGTVAFTWVPREANKAADRLSNLAMDGRSVDRRYDDTEGDETSPSAGPSKSQDRAQGAGTSPGANPAKGAQTPRDANPAEGAPTPRGAAAARAGRGTVAPDLAESAPFMLVRHGRTQATMAGLLDGRGGSDAPLTAEGHRESVAAGHALRRLLRGAPPPLLVTSTLLRARATGAAIAEVLGVEPETDAAWDEQHFGDWEGCPIAQICADAGGAAAYELLRSDPDYARPRGESRAELTARVLGAYDALTARSRAQGRPVVVVSHRAALLAVLDAALGLRSPWSLAIAPASVSAVRRWADGFASVDFVNDMGHLRS